MKDRSYKNSTCFMYTLVNLGTLGSNSGEQQNVKKFFKAIRYN